MSIEGLYSILEKREVVPTVSADDLLVRPNQVESDYLFHVRTYLPVNRAGEAGEGQLNVETLERRLIQQVKDGRVPRGYITGGYGYGKTTTALYLWERAQSSNIVVVPPFTLDDLPSFLKATYGWLRYKLNTKFPGLTEKLDSLYNNTVDRSLERIGEERGLTLEQMQGLWQEGLLKLEVQPQQYINFFEKCTEIALEAGFEGLVVVPDEIQQYIRPRLQEGGDPVAAFFQIIQLLNSRATGGDWCFGFVMVATLEELGLIRDTFRRTDLLHRMKDLQLDLTTLYDAQFAVNLWELMAERFDFDAERDRIADPETLLALGQITARTDISDGPRTIINVFRRMVERYVEREGQISPYTPIDLITDFLDEQKVAFAGNDRLRVATRRALGSEIVRDNLVRYAAAIKLAAAFPTYGVPRLIQEKYHQEAPLAELMQLAIGELVRSGAIRDGAIALIGLEQARLPTEWLPTTVREFRLGYSEFSDQTRERAEEGFLALLRKKVFPSGKWKEIKDETTERTYVSNRSLVFEGAFDALKVKFPRRRVHIRLLWEDEPVKDAHIRGDVCIEYRMSLHLDLSPEERSQYTEDITSIEGTHTARINLNFQYNNPDLVSPQIQNRLKDVWSPYELSPLVLTNIYQLIEEKRANGDIPKKEDDLIRNGFQPEILDNLVQNLFNKGVGQTGDVAGIAITEWAVGILLDQRYGDTYHSLVGPQNWQSTIQKYENALKLLDNPAQRQGEDTVEGTKEDIAKEYFGLSNTGFDSLQKAYSELLEIVSPFRGGEKGVVRFTLHPLESDILAWLKASDRKEMATRAGKKQEIHLLNIASIIRSAGDLGYLEEEVTTLIDLLQIRGMVEQRSDWLAEVLSDAPDVNELRQQLTTLKQELSVLISGFRSNQLDGWQRDVEGLRQRLVEITKQKVPDPQMLTKLYSNLRVRQNDVSKFAQDQQRTLGQQLQTLQRGRAFPITYLEALQKPLPVVVEYASQVNNLRTQLFQEGERLKKAVEERRKAIREPLQNLERPNLSYDVLAGYSRELPQYRKNADEAEQIVQQFEIGYQHYNAWRDLVSRGGTLVERLKQMNPAQIGELQQEFDKFAVDIRGEITSQSNRLKALPLHTAFTTRLDELFEAARKIDDQAREEFASLQNYYREALAGLQAKGVNAWRDVSFNAQDPRSSREDLVNRAQTNLTEVARGLTKMAKDSRQSLITIQNNLGNLSAREQKEIGRQGQQLLVVVESCLEGLKIADTSIADINIIDDIKDGFPGLIAKILAVRDDLASLGQSVAALRGRLTEIEPTEDETRLLALLRNTNPDHASEMVDIVELMMAFEGTPEAFWSAIQGLQHKDRIRLQLQLKDTE
jgi:hypothetical protein